MTQISFPMNFSIQSIKNIQRIITAPLQCDGFALLRSEILYPILTDLVLIPWEHQWESFSSSWCDLGVDHYMADGGRYRRRRYATFLLNARGAFLQPRQPHYQTLDYNPLNGGVERWFEPVESKVIESPILRAIMQLVYQVVTELAAPHFLPVMWHVEMHQFRIEARLGQVGFPTPEGIHRDGVDWICVVMIKRENIAFGETSIYNLHHQCVSKFALMHALDTAFINDHRVYHGVTAIEVVEPDQPAYRDVLVLTLRKKG